MREVVIAGAARTPIGSFLGALAEVPVTRLRGIAVRADIVVAGGMESMSGAPYLLPRARAGLRMGHAEVVDPVIRDGLWDVYTDTHMGDCAELCTAEMKIDRAAQDAHAAESYRRALGAIREGRFAAEIVPVEVPQRKGPPAVVTEDEERGRDNIEKLGGLRAQGRITVL